MRAIARPTLPPTGLHAALDAVVQPLADLYDQQDRLVTRSNEIEQATLDEAAQAEIDAARAASLGRAAPPTSKTAHALVADGLETAREFATVTAQITEATGALHAALASHGHLWADEIEQGALATRTETFTAAVDALDDAELSLQAARGVVAHLRSGEPMQPVQRGRVWTLMRPSGDPTTMGEVLDGLRRYGTEQPPGRPGRLRFAMTGSRTG